MNEITCLGFLIFFQCQLPPTPPPADTYCQIARPIFFSKNDTRETKEQIDIANRKWKALCQRKGR